MQHLAPLAIAQREHLAPARCVLASPYSGLGILSLYTMLQLHLLWKKY